MNVGDLQVNRMGFGAMRVCGPNVWGPPRDRPAAHGVLRRALELGVNFFDTADSYGPHVDEELIAEALHPYPKDLVIATKGGLLRPRPSAWDPDGRPEHLKRAASARSSRCRTATTLATVLRRTYCRPASGWASLFCRGIRWAPVRFCAPNLSFKYPGN
jgi:aryl-alcohol dehydrogenase-like predicted oxidoreductase